MTLLANASINLTAINDSYSVSLSPNTCIIHADYDGSNPELTNAFTDIKVFRGETEESFTLEFDSASNANIGYLVTTIDSITKRISITSLPSSVLSGQLYFTLKVTSTNHTIPISFQFNVIRAATMLDWIQDWENNKTTIGSTYILTPKIFVGKKVQTAADLNALCGVYIGPDNSLDNSAGLYGYYEGETIFQLNKNGGIIGGWNITTKYLFSSHIVLDTEHQYIGVSKTAIDTTAESADMDAIYDETYQHRNLVKLDGGVCMFYSTNSDYGIEGYLPADTIGGVLTYKPTFQLGHINQIAGWHFDNESLWIGSKNNTAQAYTSASGDITIGTAGLRGINWYIDNNGGVSFAGGLINFATSGTAIAGWKITENRLSSKYIALISDDGFAGLYLTPNDISNIANSSLSSYISNNGGVSVKVNSNSADIYGYVGNNMVFHLASVGNSQIAAWKFNSGALFTGTEASSGFTSTSGSITIGSSGIRGYKWRLESDGSGALANGYITWAADGTLIIGGSNGTTIQNNAILTGSIQVKDGNNIVKAGMLASGSGSNGIRFFAGSDTPSSAPFRIDETGFLYASNAQIVGNIQANTGKIGNWIIDSNGLIVSGDNASNRIVFDATADAKKITLRKDDIAICSEEEINCGGLNNRGTSGAVISLDAETGVIKTQAIISGYVGSVPKSTVSCYGIYVNYSGIKAYVDINDDIKHYGAIVADGNGNINKSNWELNSEEVCVVGVYGSARNSGTAPAYGGYFKNLKACGLIFGKKIIKGSSPSSTQLLSDETFVIGLQDSGVTKTIVLPNDGVEGRVVFVRQVGLGTTRVTVNSPQELKIEGGGITYVDVTSGNTAIFVMANMISSENQRGGTSTTVEVWTVDNI